MKIGKWEKNGMQRVYINGLLSQDEKAWFEKGSDGKVELRTKAFSRPSTVLSMLKESSGEQAIEECLPDLPIVTFRTMGFDEFWTLVK